MKLSNVIGILVIAILASVVIAGVTMNYYHPETATVTPVSVKEYLNGVAVANGTTFDWDQLEAGVTYDWNYTVENIGSVTCSVYRIVEGLPDGWIETWTHNSTYLMPYETKVGNLTLTVPVNASGSYSWHSYLTAEYEE